MPGGAAATRTWPAPQRRSRVLHRPTGAMGPHSPPHLGTGGELLEDRRDGLLELLLVLLLIIRDASDALPAPQQLFVLRVDHVDNDGTFRVLGHLCCATGAP